MTDDTKTTLSSIINPEDVKVAVDLWQSGTKDTLKALRVMGKIGTAINLIYTQGESKAIKKGVVTDVVKETFNGMGRRERSDFRAIANNLGAIETHAEKNNIKSLSPTYLLNKWRHSMREEETPVVKEPLSPTKVLKAVLKETPKTLVAETAPIKTGYDNIVRPDPLSGKEVVANVGAAVNHAITYFNQGKLNADDLAMLEKYLTNTLQNINKIEEDDMLLTASL